MEVTYRTLVCPQLDYAAPIWNPCQKNQIKQAGNMQRIAARWTYRPWVNISKFASFTDALTAR